MSYDASIIVPIYNVEKFIEKCVISLFEQDHKSIEYIFVNDCTLDNSMQVLNEVIQKYPNRKNDIKIINKLVNEGLGQARKTGFDNATGEYILHIDSDDWCEHDMISLLYKKAKKDNADIVCCDYFVNYQNQEIYNKQNYGMYIQEKKNYLLIGELLTGNISPSVWNKFCKYTLYKGIDFPNFSFGEDGYLSTQLIYHADKISYINRAFLHYNQINLESLTSNYSAEKNIKDLQIYSINIIKFLIKKNIYNQLIEYHKVGMIYKIMITSNDNFNEMADIIYPESKKIKYIWRNPRLGFLKKIVFSLVFLNMEFIFNYLRKVYMLMKK